MGSQLANSHESRCVVRPVAVEPRELGDDIGAILDALPAMVGYWDAGLRNRFANGAYIEFFGLTPEQIRGRHASEVLGLFAPPR